MHEEKLKAMEAVFRGCDSFILNMNDTFAYACGDSEEMSEYDFNRLVPVIAKYGKDALTAYVAVKRQAEPISCKCNHKNENYYAAKKEIEAIKATDESLMNS